jgi:hypothetical protein
LDHEATEGAEFQCGSKLYRLARVSSDVDWDQNAFTSKAFQLRPDEEGLSMYVADACTFEEALADADFNKCYGYGTILAGHAWDCELLIDRESDIKVQIMGVPSPLEDREGAVDLADRLAGFSREGQFYRPPIKRTQAS